MAGYSVSTVASRHGLDEKQRAFVSLILTRGLSPGAAAVEAGYESERSGYAILAQPSVRRTLHECVALSLQADAPINLQVLRRIRDDNNAAAGVRADIALKLIRLAGHIEPKAGTEEAPLKSLSEMSTDELKDWRAKNQAEIERLEQALAERATDVSAPVSAPKPTQSGPKPKTYLD